MALLGQVFENWKQGQKKSDPFTSTTVLVDNVDDNPRIFTSRSRPIVIYHEFESTCFAYEKYLIIQHSVFICQKPGKTSLRLAILVRDELF